MYKYLLVVIKSEISEVSFFSVISDDTTDSFEKSLCTITLNMLKKTEN